MTEVAGEVCDGFLCHGFTTERYLREVTIPALERGRAKAGKTLDDFEIVGPSFVVTGTNDEEIESAATGTRQQIAFYGSTPAYRGVLELHGWGGLQAELNALSKQGKWVEMGELIDDEILDTFAVVGRARADRSRAAPPLRRRRRPHQLLRAVQDRPRALAGSARRPQSGLEQRPAPRRGSGHGTATAEACPSWSSAGCPVARHMTSRGGSPQTSMTLAWIARRTLPSEST